MRAILKAGLAFILACPAAAMATPPPVGAYAALPTGAFPRLSPDGSAMAMIGSSGGQPAFVIVHFDGSPPKVFSAGGWSPQWIEWKSPNLLVAGLLTTLKDWNTQHILANTRLLVLAADGSRVMPVDLTFNGGWVPLASDRITAMLPNDPDHVLMATAGGATVSRVDLRDGNRKQVQDTRNGVRQWYADSTGVIRVGVKYRNDTSTDRRPTIDLLARTNEADDWHTVVSDRLDGTLGPMFAGFDPADADRILLDVDGPDGHRVIQAYGISTGRAQSIVAQEAGVDVVPILRQRQLIGYATQGMSTRFIYVQPAWQHDAQAISHALGTGTVELMDRTPDGRHVLACVHDGSIPQQYWMLDRSGTKASLHPVLTSYEGIPPSQVGETLWISYKARDGLMIQAMVTTPPGHEAGVRLPFVVLPHGGPAVHEGQGFDWMAQFLASRGYGVLQPEFRGSAGFGRALYDAGNRSWGGAMQDDITDGTHYLIAQHLADPARIALVGASYGGYAALEGVAREPTLYRAAAALAPVTDLPLMFGGMSIFARPGFDLLMPAGDFNSMQAASPAHDAARIQVPVLLVHGTRDFTVPVAQTEIMAGALKAAGRPAEVIYLDGADHHLEREADRTAWLTALERFLARNLKS